MFVAAVLIGVPTSVPAQHSTNQNSCLGERIDLRCAVPPVIAPDLSPACIVDDLPEDLQWWQQFGIRTCDRTLAPES